ncbi:MAG TPA: hypothetical protein V6D33_04905 [Cyanophyceae cyanobacterium]
MEETIRIRSVDRANWSSTLQGFQSEQIKQLFAICGVDERAIGYICESVDNKYYINGKPTVDYASLQAAAGALIKSTDAGKSS